MIALALAVALAAVEPVAACHSDTAVLTVVLEGVEVDVGNEFVLRRLWTGPEGTELSPRAVVAAGTFVDDSQASVSFELRVGEAWRLRRGTDEVELRVPKAVRRSDRVQVLGVGASHVWLAAPGMLLRVDLRAAAVEVGRVGRRSDIPQAFNVAEEALVVAGIDLLSCTAPTECARLAQLPARVSQVVAGPGGWLLAARRDGGLYRAPASMPAAAGLLIAGEVVALCAVDAGETWAVMVRDDELRVVAAATDTPAVRPFAAAEILGRGLPGTTEPALVAHVLRVARDRAWPELEEMALTVMTDEQETIRRHAAEALGGVLSARATAALWLLGRDDVADVRVEALHACASRCRDDPAMTCTHALSTFVGDDDIEVAWTARDLLLEVDPRVALDSAPAEYKLGAIATLVGRLQRNGELAAERALEMLAGDRSPAVRAAARMALAGAQR